MKENVNENENELNIDLVRLALALWDHIVIILLVGAVLSAGLFLYARMYITPRYEANVLFFVNNSTISVTGAVRISTGDLNSASELVDTYVAILQSRANMELVIEESGVNYSYEQLRGMVSAKAVNSTGLFRVIVNSANPEEARNLANTIAVILPQKITDIVSTSNVVVVDYAVTPRTRVSPNYIRYAEIGFLIGVLLSSAIVVLAELLDNVIHDEDYLTQHFQVPVLATIPDLTAKSSRRYGKGYGYGYGKGYEYGYGYGNAYAKSAAKSKENANGKE